MQGKRVMRSHMYLETWKNELEKNPDVKLIQTIRNPRDTLLSYYKFYCMNEALGAYNGTWDEFFEMVRDQKVTDYFEFHAEWYPYIKKRNNSLVVFYEEMKADLRGTVEKIAEFLGHNLSKKVLDIIVQKTTFENMAKDQMLTPQMAHFRKNFARQGEVGNWKKYFNKDQIEYVDKKCGEMLDPVGLHFEYE